MDLQDLDDVEQPDDEADNICPDCDGQGEVTTMGGPNDWEPPIIKCRWCCGTGKIG